MSFSVICCMSAIREFEEDYLHKIRNNVTAAVGLIQTGRDGATDQLQEVCTLTSSWSPRIGSICNGLDTTGRDILETLVYQMNSMGELEHETDRQKICNTYDKMFLTYSALNQYIQTGEVAYWYDGRDKSV